MNRPYNIADILADIDEHMAEEQFLNEQFCILTEWFEKGRFIPSYGETAFNTLDGSDVAAWLQSHGYTVVSNGDTGRNGYAETACGWYVSTNGYVRRV